MDIPLINASKVPNSKKKLDNFFFVIETHNKIKVECYKNIIKENRIVSGKLQKVIMGKTAEDVSYSILDNFTDLSNSHYAYLGRELQKAENALNENKKYNQD